MVTSSNRGKYRCLCQSEYIESALTAPETMDIPVNCPLIVIADNRALLCKAAQHRSIESRTFTSKVESAERRSILETLWRFCCYSEHRQRD